MRIPRFVPLTIERAKSSGIMKSEKGKARPASSRRLAICFLRLTVSRKKQMASRREDAGRAFPFSDFMIPDDFARSIVNGTNRGIRIKITVAACPALGFARRRQIKNAECATGVHIEQFGLRIKAGRHPVGSTVGSRLDQRSIGPWSVIRFGNWSPARIDAGSPGFIDKWGCHQMHTVRAIEHKKESVAAGLCQQFTGLATKGSVEEHRRLDGIPIVDIMRGGLKVPDELAGIRIERHN